MRHSLSLLLVGATAVAAPARAIKAITVDVECDHMIFLAGSAAPEEPGGLRVPNDAGDDWRAIGLVAGDTVRELNGSAVSEQLLISGGVSLLEIERAGQPMVVRLVVHDSRPDAIALTDAQWKDMLESLALRTLATPMSHDGRASGVRIVDSMLAMSLRLDTGDIVRSIAGVPIRNEDALLNALHDLAIGDSAIEVDRLGRRVVVIVTRKAPLDYSGIRATAKNHYEVPHAIAAALADDPRLVLHGLDSTLVDDGKVRGTKVFAIEPESLAASLGLRDDDIVRDLDGTPLDSLDRVSTALYDLRDAPSLTLHLERHGKPLALTYVIQ